MALTETLLFYLLIGLGVAAAVLVGGDHRSARDNAFRSVTAVLFWPLYLPVLLARPTGTVPDAPGVRHSEQALPPAEDDMAAETRRVEHELDHALQSLEGWGESVLACEHDRFAQLRAAWRLQANRIRELDRLLCEPGFTEPDDSREPGCGTGPGAEGRRRQCEQARRQNIRRLRSIRDQLRHDLMGTLAWVRELVTMIHLARHTGAPASRAEELVAQIAAAVEGLSEVSRWKDDDLPPLSSSVATAQPTAAQ